MSTTHATDSDPQFKKIWFVVSSFNPSEKYMRKSNWVKIFPRGENKKYLSCHHLKDVGSPWIATLKTLL